MIKNLNPHRAFLCIAIFFGLLLTIITPPFQVPDEINHFYRAWQVSSGRFSSVKQDQRLGGYVPKSLIQFSSIFRPYAANPYNSLPPKQVWQSRSIPLNPGDTIFKDFTNTALYPAVLYMPQASGIHIGRLFGAGPLWLLYSGRLVNLLVFIVLCYQAIKIVPFKKWLFVALLSLPMSLSVSASLSADVLVNALSFLMLAVVLNLSFNETIQLVTGKHILLVFVLSVLIGMAKLVYVPILFLLILIPARKFRNTRAKTGIVVFLICAGIGSAYIQKKAIDSKYIPYSEYNVAYREHSMLNKGADMNKQLEFIKEYPTHTAGVFVRSFFREFGYMTRSYIGILGWADIKLPAWFVYLAYLAIFFIAVTKTGNNAEPGFTMLQRSLFGLAGLCMIALIMISQYLTWDQVGENRVYPLQGRYFIPVFPLFFIMFFNILKIREGHSFHSALAKGALAFCVFSGALSICPVAAKSYTLQEYTDPVWKLGCSFRENRSDTCGYGNGVEYVTAGSDTIAVLQKTYKKHLSSEKTFTGDQALKLTAANPYGFTVRIFKGRRKDKLTVSCRSSGYGGYLVVQEYPQGIYYHSSRTYPEKDSLGWKYKEVQFILPHDIPAHTELRVFAWCPGNDSIYLDDFRIAYFNKD